MEFWINIPIAYDLIQLCLTGGFMKPVTEEIKMAKNKRILDLGCGTGTLVKYLSPKDYTGIDINPKFINLAKRKYPQFSFLPGDITRKKYPESKFDYMIVVNVLHHLTDKQVRKLFNHLRRYKGAKRLIIVESQPRGRLIGKLLERLDAGDNFRRHDRLNELVRAEFKVKDSAIVLAPFRTYQYYVAICELR